jgi:hypothetical protein
MSDRTWGLLLGAVALVLFAIAARLAAKAMRRVRAGGRARGTIVGSERTQSGGTSHGFYYRPRVRFTASDGGVHTFVSPVGRGKPYAEGAEVEVTYDPANPADAEVAGFVANWLAPVAMVAFGVAALATAWRLVFA